jgi:bacteriophage N4 adsorption protein B
LLWLLCAWILLSGLDDLFIDAAALVRWWLGRKRLATLPQDARRDKPIAVLVPCWQESDVIAQMLLHNLSVIDYANYDIFVGAYPNDPATLEAVRSVEKKSARVHLAVCPHDGPTSKADCLNWAIQHMMLAEEARGERFACVLMHDAEDLIHPGEMKLIDERIAGLAMIQVPVLALPTPFGEFTHGVYCDEFAEGQMKELPTRVFLGGFLPSCGVGTAIQRDMIDRLAESGANKIFEPVCLTEDYELGRRIQSLGGRQEILAVTVTGGALTATREYFPRHWRQAIRQRTRWVTGIALQGWELNGWRGGWRRVYWYWRDRKGLVGNPLSLVANALFAAALVGVGPELPALAFSGLAFQVERCVVRAWFSSRIYGWRYAAGAPVRMVWGNFINTAATFGALKQYGRAKWRGEPLRWLKTAHAYPSREALMAHKRRLGEVLLDLDYITNEVLDWALAAKGALRLGDFLVSQRKITDAQRWEALSLQQGMEVFEILPEQVAPRIARALPLALVDELKVIPVRLELGKLLLAAAAIPTDAMQQQIRDCTEMRFEFSLVTNERFDALRRLL